VLTVMIEVMLISGDFKHCKSCKVNGRTV